jgi:hypothetical protein
VAIFIIKVTNTGFVEVLSMFLSSLAGQAFSITLLKLHVPFFADGLSEILCAHAQGFCGVTVADKDMV